MADGEDPKHFQPGNAAARPAALVRKLPAARRLLVATIGAATVQFVAGCGNTYVANLMAPPESGRSGGAGEAGRAGRGGQGGVGGRVGNAGTFVANLMAPPFVPDSGAGAGGSGGSAGAAGTNTDDMDAGMDDDAGQA
jgi:hypothetical protein